MGGMQQQSSQQLLTASFLIHEYSFQESVSAALQNVPVSSIAQHSFPIWNLSLSPQGTWLCILKNARVELRSASSKFNDIEIVYPIRATDDAKRKISWSNDEKLLAISFGNQGFDIFSSTGVKLYTLSTNTELSSKRTLSLQSISFKAVRENLIFHGTSPSSVAHVSFLETNVIYERQLWKYSLATCTSSGKLNIFLFKDEFQHSKNGPINIQSPQPNNSFFASILNIDLFNQITNLIQLIWIPDSCEFLVLADIRDEADSVSASPTFLCKCRFIFSKNGKVQLQSKIQLPKQSVPIAESRALFQKNRKHGHKLNWKMKLDSSKNHVLVHDFDDVIAVYAVENLNLLHIVALSDIAQGKLDDLKLKWWDDNQILIVYADCECLVYDFVKKKVMLQSSQIPVDLISRFIIPNNENMYCLKKDIGIFRTPIQANNIINVMISRRIEGKISKFTISSSIFRKIFNLFAYPVRLFTDTFLWSFEDNGPSFIDVSIPLYRLYHTIKVSPMDYLAILINREQFDAALEFAQSNDLDPDAIYKAKWAKAAVTKQSINTLLSMIKNKSWILETCIQRLPQSPDDVEYFYNFGLNLIEEYQNLAQKYKDLSKEKANEVKQICEKRRILLGYLKKFQSFSKMYPYSKEGDDSDYQKRFEEFRKSTTLQSALFFARNSDLSRLDILFDLHMDELLVYRLQIVDAIPESNPPEKYEKILPSVEEWQKRPLLADKSRSQDWSDLIVSLSQSGSITQLSSSNLPMEYDSRDLKEWYFSRLTAIDQSCGLIELMLSFADISFQKGIVDAKQWKLQIEDYEQFIYSGCQEALSTGFQKFSSLSFIDICKLYLHQDLVTDKFNVFKNLVIPMINKKYGADKQKLILEELLMNAANEDTNFIILVLKDSTFAIPLDFRLIGDSTTFYKILIEALFNDKASVEQLQQLNEFIPESEHVVNLEFRRSFDTFRSLFNVHRLVLKCGTRIEIKILKQNINNADYCRKLITRIVRHRNASHDDSQWLDCLQDILVLRKMLPVQIEISYCFIQVLTEILRNRRYNLVRSILYAEGRASPLKQNVIDELVLEVAREFIDNALPEDYPIWFENTRQCLDLSSKSQPIKDEVNLLRFMETLMKLYVKHNSAQIPSPMEVRLSKRKADFLVQLIEETNSAYLDDEVITLCKQLPDPSAVHLLLWSTIICKALNMNELSLAIEKLFENKILDIWQFRDRPLIKSLQRLVEGQKLELELKEQICRYILSIGEYKDVLKIFSIIPTKTNNSQISSIFDNFIEHELSAK